METRNDFMVGVRGDEIGMLRPPVGFMDKATALRLAAWLVALADPEDDDEFPRVLEAVRNT